MEDAVEEKKTPNLTIPILVVLLVIASFLVGSLWTRVKNIEISQKPAAKEEAQNKPQAQPTSAVLGEQDRSKIEAGSAASRGSENAKVTIVEFSDFQCPYCANYSTTTYNQIKKEYGDKIRYIFRDFPLGFHPFAQKAAEAARCAGDQSKFWEMHDLLFAKNSEWSAEKSVDGTFVIYAGQIGADKAKFKECLASGKFAQAVKDDVALGSTVGVSGTPSFFINGQMLVGAQSFESFKTIIDKELAK